MEDRDSAQNTAVVEFDLSWDNSWRSPVNYDAAWVFLKVQVGSTWVHGILKNSGADPAGTSPGSNKDLEIKVPADVIGAFIYRKSSGTGTVTSTDVRFKLDYAATATAGSVTINDTTNITVKVTGIEMVYVPTESFYIGDPSGTVAGNFKWQSGAAGTPQITASLGAAINTLDNSYDDVQLEGSGIRIDGDGGLDTDADGAIDNAAFPTGYSAFYMMKYEVTEGQWVDFFNMLDATQKAKHDVTDASEKNSDSVVSRNTIAWTSGDAATSRPDRVMNYLSWVDLAAYADWAGLRPMTELEFGKACRGPLSAVAGEYAWGSTGITAGATFSGSPENGLETFTTANANAAYNNTTFSQGDSYLGAGYAQGPVRSGIFATGSSTRSSAGAGYYGAMELSGNVWERAVTVGNTTGRAFDGSHGDGTLSANGYATTATWPGIAAGEVTSNTGSGLLGGGWCDATAIIRVAARYYASYAFPGPSFNPAYGGRCVRTAP